MKPGTQPPRFAWAPPAFSTALAQEYIDLAESLGWVLDPWQRSNFLQNCGCNEKDEWVATEVGLICTRQNGKNGEIVVRELGGLVLSGEKLQTHTAHRFDTSAEHFRIMRELFEGRPELSKLLKRNGIRASHGEEAIELSSGSRLLFKARSKGAGRGFAGNLVVLDEAFYLSEMGSLIPTLSAQYNPQVWLTSSAPLRREESDVLRRLIRRGRALAKGKGDPENDKLSYAEWSSEDINIDDPEAVLGAIRRSNPSLGMVRSNGTGLSLEFILGTERGQLDDEEFCRERLGIFDDGESASSIISLPAWQEGDDPEAVFTGTPSFAVDVAPDQAWSSIAVGGRDQHGNPYGEVVDRRKGTGWLVDRLVELEAKYPGARRVADLAGPVRSIAEECRGRKVPLEPVSLGEHAGACGLLLELIREGRLRHRPDNDLESAIENAKKRDMGDGLWLWSRRTSTADISPLVAFTLAIWASGAGDETEVLQGSLMPKSNEGN